MPEILTCSSCRFADSTLRGDEPVLECHLNPPMTMPDAPEIPEFEPQPDLDPDDGPFMTIEAFAAPHRYPVVTDTDWCGQHERRHEPGERVFSDEVLDQAQRAVDGALLLKAALGLLRQLHQGRHDGRQCATCRLQDEIAAWLQGEGL